MSALEPGVMEPCSTVAEGPRYHTWNLKPNLEPVIPFWNQKSILNPMVLTLKSDIKPKARGINLRNPGNYSGFQCQSGSTCGQIGEVFSASQLPPGGQGYLYLSTWGSNKIASSYNTLYVLNVILVIISSNG
jgi:hypothetical protein